MTINYKAVYDIQYYVDQMRAADRKIEQAKGERNVAGRQYMEACSKISGVPISDLKFSNDSCMAKGIMYHVYHIKVRNSRDGSHENKCIFCGCDDYNDLY